jgi:prefoldin beta subunit
MTSAVGATMGPEMEAAVAELRAIQGTLQSLMDGRAALQTQAHENEMVKSEFKLLEDDASVFKLVGPVLVKQDLQEARANVDKRIEYIKEELGRVDAQTKESEKKMEAQRGVVMQMQRAQADRQGGGGQ